MSSEKEPIENMQKDEPSVCHTEYGPSLPVELLGNSANLPVGGRDDA